MTDSHFPSKSQMKRREIQCVTHHHACDCREAKFARAEESVASLKDQVSEAEDLAYQLNENLKAAEKEIERLKVISSESVNICHEKCMEENDRLEARIEILENPSDGRCMEIGALREEVERLKKIVENGSVTIESYGLELTQNRKQLATAKEALLDIRPRAQNYLATGIVARIDEALAKLSPTCTVCGKPHGDKEICPEVAG